MQAKYQLDVISISDMILERDCRDLEETLGDKVDIHAYTLEQVRQGEKLHGQLILLIGPDQVTREVVPYLPKGVDYIFNRRSVDHLALPALRQIPAGSEVLVVNDCYTNACELLEELQELEVNDFHYFPYNPMDPRDPYGLNSSYSSKESHQYTRILNCQWWESQQALGLPAYSGRPFQYAITAGERQEVPAGIPQVFDLGTRRISLITIANILLKLTGSATADNLVTSRYMRSLVNLSMALAVQNDQNLFLQAQLKSVIANLQNGVLLTDKRNQILLYNQRALRILNTDCLENKNLSDILPGLHSENQLEDFMVIRGKTVYLSKTKIRGPHEESCYLIFLEGMDEIEQINQQYRKKKKEDDKRAKYTFDDIIYSSEAMERLIKKARAFTKTPATILINGESGTGKELLAHSIHHASDRSGGPFIAINCGAISESLLESELFGYEEGAFTGAKKGGHKGLFEQAHRGTLFLDEIGDTPLTTQTKLLRTLQEKEILKVGGSRIIPIDVRIIAATNQDLFSLTLSGRFRRDLYYRLKVLPLTIPPLRQRREDIRPLFLSLLRKEARRTGKALALPSESLLSLLESYDWPGNVRELVNIVEYYLNIQPVSENILEDIRQALENNPEKSQEEKRTAGAGQEGFSKIRLKPESLLILKALLEAEEAGSSLMGRASIGIFLRITHGLSFSDQQIKGRISGLAREGLVLSLVGKGTLITEKGRAYLDWQKQSQQPAGQNAAGRNTLSKGYASAPALDKGLR